MRDVLYFWFSWKSVYLKHPNADLVNLVYEFTMVRKSEMDLTIEPFAW